MALPKIDLPLYEIELPSTGKKVKYRPFTVKEEKILLTAQESQDRDQIILSIKQIVNNCLVNYNIDDLSLFDLEYLLITIRSKSIENTVQFEIEDPDTKEKVNLKLNLSDVTIKKDENHKNTIKVSDQYTLYLKYPNIDDFNYLVNGEGSNAEKNYKIMISCMEKLVSQDEVYKLNEFSKKEVDAFIESLNADVTKKIKKFFDTIPKVRHEIPYVNSNGDNKIFVIQGTQTFFI
jgi:hypothetical protein